MRRITMLSVAALAAAALIVAPEALAQRRGDGAVSVVVINIQRVVAESVLGRDMTTKLQQVQTQVGAEAQALAPEQQSLEQERQRVAAATRNLTPEQTRNNAQFQQFQQRARQFETRANALRGDFECSQAIALRDFNNQVGPVVQSVMRSRGAGAVLDAGSVQYMSPESDITTAVIQQLDQNAATRTANVARHPVAECLPQQAAQAPAAQ